MPASVQALKNAEDRGSRGEYSTTLVLPALPRSASLPSVQASIRLKWGSRLPKSQPVHPMSAQRSNSAGSPRTQSMPLIVDVPPRTRPRGQ